MLSHAPFPYSYADKQEEEREHESRGPQEVEDPDAMQEPRKLIPHLAHSHNYYPFHPTARVVLFSSTQLK